jgi:hypothetical protein
MKNGMGPESSEDQGGEGAHRKPSEDAANREHVGGGHPVFYNAQD